MDAASDSEQKDQLRTDASGQVRFASDSFSSRPKTQNATIPLLEDVDPQVKYRLDVGQQRATICCVCSEEDIN